MTAQDLEVLRAVWDHMDECDGENAPGHSHSRPGIWDDDNRPSIAGQPCAWCATWKKFTEIINRDRAAAEARQGGETS